MSLLLVDDLTTRLDIPMSIARSTGVLSNLTGGMHVFSQRLIGLDHVAAVFFTWVAASDALNGSFSHAFNSRRLAFVDCVRIFLSCSPFRFFNPFFRPDLKRIDFITERAREKERGRRGERDTETQTER